LSAVADKVGPLGWQQKVNRACNDDPGRLWTFKDIDGPLTCEDA